MAKIARIHAGGLSPDRRFPETRAVRPRLATPPRRFEHCRQFHRRFPQATTPDKLRFYNIAQGSADECLYHLILANDLGYQDTTALQADLEEVSRLLQGYINGLKRNSQ